VKGRRATDSGGLAQVTIETRPLDSPSAYTVEFDGPTLPGEVSATASFTVTPSSLNFRFALSHLCSPGKTTDIEVSTATWEGKAVSARVLVTIEEQVYDRNARTYIYRKLAEREVVTDANGRLVFGQTFPRPGYWRVSAVTTDQRGLKATGEGWVWVWREGYAWDTSYRELGVELDKKSYLPGETARVIVKSPVSGASLFLTVEGREIYSRRVSSLPVPLRWLKFRSAKRWHRMSMSAVGSKGRFHTRTEPCGSIPTGPVGAYGRRTGTSSAEKGAARGLGFGRCSAESDGTFPGGGG
jgi:hypothetical protein